MAKGDQAERELSNLLEDDYDYAAFRSPGSGGRTQRNRPDILAVQGTILDPHGHNGLREVSEAVVVEVKATTDGCWTFDRDEIAGLEEFASRAGADAYVAVKPDLRLADHSQWYLREVSCLHETPEGNFSIRKADHEECLSIPEVFA